MKFVTDLSLSSRPRRGGAPFAPETLITPGAAGVVCVASNPLDVFGDAAGTVAAQFGEGVARVADLGPNGWDAVQPDAALRPLLGRAPVAGRRNVLPVSFGAGNMIDANGSVSVASATAFDSMGDPFAVVQASTDPAEENSFTGIRFPLGDDEHIRCRLRLRKGTSPETAVHFRRSGGGAGTCFLYVAWEPTGPVIAGTGNDVIAPVLTDITADECVLSFGFVTVVESDEFGFRVYGGSSDNSPDAIPANAPTKHPGATSLASEFQVTVGSTTEDSPYQRIANVHDITEAGLAAPAFLRFDLSDDVMPNSFPNGGTVDVAVFGRRGSWVARDVAIAPTGSLAIGPGSITGGPAGLLQALGDIVGWVAVDRTLTGSEINRLLRYHKARGAKGLLVPGGPELAPNPGGPFTSLDDWVLAMPAQNRGTMTLVDGAIRTTHITGAHNIATQIGGMKTSRLHLAVATGNSVSGTPPLLRFTQSTGAANPLGPEADDPRAGVVWTPDEPQRWVQVRYPPNADGASFDLTSISVRELRPEEDW